jgi:hypothetical protein
LPTGLAGLAAAGVAHDIKISTTEDSAGRARNTDLEVEGMVRSMAQHADMLVW